MYFQVFQCSSKYIGILLFISSGGIFFSTHYIYITAMASLIETPMDTETATILTATDLAAPATNVTKRKAESDLPEDDAPLKQSRPTVVAPKWGKISFEKVGDLQMESANSSDGKVYYRLKDKDTGKDYTILAPPMSVVWHFLKKGGNYMHPKCDWAKVKSGASMNVKLQLGTIPQLSKHHTTFETLNARLHEQIVKFLFGDKDLSKKARASAEKYAAKQKANGKEMSQEDIDNKALRTFKSSVTNPIKAGEFVPKMKAFREINGDYVHNPLHFYDKTYTLDDSIVLGQNAVIAPVLRAVVNKMPGSSKISFGYKLTGQFVVYNAGTLSGSAAPTVDRSILADHTRNFMCITKDSNKGSPSCYVNDDMNMPFLTEIEGTLKYDMRSTRENPKFNATERTAKYSCKITVDTDTMDYLKRIIDGCKTHVMKDNQLLKEQKAEWNRLAVEQQQEDGEDDSAEGRQAIVAEMADNEFTSPLDDDSVSVKCKEFVELVERDDDGNVIYDENGDKVKGLQQVMLKVREEDSEGVDEVQSIPQDTKVKLVIQPNCWIINTGGWGVSFNIALSGNNLRYEIITQAASEEDMQGPQYDL